MWADLATTRRRSRSSSSTRHCPVMGMGTTSAVVQATVYSSQISQRRPGLNQAGRAAGSFIRVSVQEPWALRTHPRRCSLLAVVLERAGIGPVAEGLVDP